MKLVIILQIFLSWSLFAKELQTNATYMPDPPSWITKGRIDKVVDHTQMIMEWDIHRVTVYWYKDQVSFEKVHGLGSTVLAITRKKDNTIHIGPKVNSDNFDQIFSHELVHVISFQKYKEAIPKWLEEGLANFVAKSDKVDYVFLAKHSFPKDVRELIHPFGGSKDDIRYHYMASQALAEMISAKCDIRNLLRLSVGQKLDSYLDTYCQIKDLNLSFQTWIKNHSKK